MYILTSMMNSPLPFILGLRVLKGSGRAILTITLCPADAISTKIQSTKIVVWKNMHKYLSLPQPHAYYKHTGSCVNKPIIVCGVPTGLSVENFVPFLDYKERAQQWKWIGAGRDSNPQLAVLFRHWLKHKNAEPVDGLGASQGSPPPVRACVNKL